MEIKRFSNDAVLWLGKENYQVYEFSGQESMASYDLRMSTNSDPEAFRLAYQLCDQILAGEVTGATEVAINPDALFLEGTFGLNFDEQEQAVQLFSQKLNPVGIRALIARLVDYCAIAEKYLIRNRALLYPDSRFAAASMNERGRHVLIGEQMRSRGLLIEQSDDKGYPSIGAVPLLFPL